MVLAWVHDRNRLLHTVYKICFPWKWIYKKCWNDREYILHVNSFYPESLWNSRCLINYMLQTNSFTTVMNCPEDYLNDLHINAKLFKPASDSWYGHLTHWGRVTHHASVNWPSLVQIMARRLDGAKPLSEPMLEYCYLDPWEQTSIKF